MKVLGKVWNDRYRTILEFYIQRKRGKGWWKVRPITLVKTNKRFNLLRIFTLYASHLEYPFNEFGKGKEGLMWEREFEVKEKVIKKRFKEFS
jgi:hypothetical protein